MNKGIIYVMVKGLPLAYSKDLLEDKESIIDSLDNIKICLQVMTCRWKL